MLEFRVLGPLEVAEDGRPLPLGGQKQRALLAILLLNAGEVVSVDRLVDELWGEHPPRTAITSLQNSVSQLRKLLGAERLVTRPPGYVLRLERDVVDVSRFERLVRSANDQPPPERAQILAAALDLWRGPPLSDFAFEPFAQNEIGRLGELRLAAAEDWIDAELESGRHAGLVGQIETLVADHPLRERLHGQLMLALYRSGRQAEALKAYHEARRALVDELGIEPSPALQHLHSSILRQESALEAVGRRRGAPDHYEEVVRALLSGRLVTVIGPGASPAGIGADIASYLADSFGCPPEQERELTRVSQYVAVTQGIGPLYDELHSLLTREHPPSPVPGALARLAVALRGADAPRQLLVTANYDDTIERAFAEVGEEVDVVSYIANGRDRGRFMHLRPDGSARVVELPNAYGDLSPDLRTVILKIHGQVDPSPDREWESFVVSEDDYIDYLARTDIANLLPVTLTARLRRSHFLFLGYALQRWSFRVFLHRVWGDEKVRYRSWAVHAALEPLEREFWRLRGIDVFDVPLEEYLQELATALELTVRAAA